MTTTTNPDPITQAVAAITAPPPPDPQSLLDLAAATRRSHLDPLYQARPDLIAREEAAIAAILARAGVTQPPPETPQQRAARELDEEFPSRGAFEEPVAAIVAAEIARVEAMRPEERTRQVETLRQEVGALEHRDLVAQAQRGAGNQWSDAILASRHALQLFAAQGRHEAAYARAKARLAQ